MGHWFWGGLISPSWWQDRFCHFRGATTSEQPRHSPEITHGFSEAGGPCDRLSHRRSWKHFPLKLGRRDLSQPFQFTQAVGCKGSAPRNTVLEAVRALGRDSRRVRKARLPAGTPCPAPRGPLYKAGPSFSTWANPLSTGAGPWVGQGGGVARMAGGSLSPDRLHVQAWGEEPWGPEPKQRDTGQPVSPWCGLSVSRRLQMPLQPCGVAVLPAGPGPGDRLRPGRKDERHPMVPQ